MKKLLKTTSSFVLAGTMALAPLAATADPWVNQAGSDLSFLPEGQVSAGAAGEVQGEGWPALLYYAVLAAPSLTALLNSAIVNHFPVMIIQDAWESIRG